MRHLMTIHYLTADGASDRRAEVRADAHGMPELGSTVRYDGPTTFIPVRRVLTVETYGPCGPRTLMGIAHVLTGPRRPCFGSVTPDGVAQFDCSAELLDIAGNYYCAAHIAEQQRAHAAELRAFDDFHAYADACARVSR